MPNNESKLLTYTVFPMRDSTTKAVIFWVVVILTIWGVWLNIENLLLTVVAGAVLIASLSSFYLPTTYRLDAEGASWNRFSGNRSISWSRVRRVSDEKDGLFLSPFAGRSMMENFRGLYLPYRANRDEILRLVRQFAPNAKGWKDQGNPTNNEPPTAVKTPNYYGHRR